MKKVWILLLALMLLLAVPANAAGNLVYDEAGLLTDGQVQQLEAKYAEYVEIYGFTPVVVTTDSFGGMSAEAYAGQFYDTHGFPQDGILYLVNLTEGEWYILTNGLCYDTLADSTTLKIGEELVDFLREGDYFAAFSQFPELTSVYFEDLGVMGYGLIIAGCLGVGCLIGLIVAGIMALRMKSVRSQNAASDYVRSGSMQLTSQRDIFLYSHVSRTPRPKSNSSGGGHGGSRGGAGGKI